MAGKVIKKRMTLTKTKKKIIIFLALIFLAVISLGKGIFPKVFVINKSYSMPVGVYIIDNDTNYSVGDIVAIIPPKNIKELMLNRGYLSKSDDYLIKKIAGMEGDVYKNVNDLAYINDKYIGNVYKVDSKKRPMPNYLGEHVIQNGYFLAIADNRPNSFDSRYFGLLKITDIKYKLQPLITFK